MSADGGARLTDQQRVRVDEVLSAVLLQPRSQRRRFICDSCGADDAVRREVLSLLEQCEALASDPFLETPAELPTSALPEQPEHTLPGGIRLDLAGAAARAMRKALLDKAHGGGGPPGPGGGRLDGSDLAPGRGQSLAAEHAEALDQALDRLERCEPRWGAVFEMRFFLGLSVQRVGDALGVNPELVEQDWSFTRSWILRALSRAASQ